MIEEKEVNMEPIQEDEDSHIDNNVSSFEQDIPKELYYQSQCQSHTQSEAKWLHESDYEVKQGLIQSHLTDDTKTESPIETRSDIIKKKNTTEFSSLRPTRYEMPNHRSYHGEITDKEAEKRLIKHSERNCYLTRYSRNSRTYVLSVIISHTNHGVTVHLKLKIDSEEPSYTLEGTGKIFQMLDELLSFYGSNPLSPEIRNIGSPCLPPELQQTSPHQQEPQQASLHHQEPQQQASQCQLELQQHASPRQQEPQQHASPRQQEPQQASPHQQEPQQASPHQQEPQQASPCQQEPQQASPCQQDSQHDMVRILKEIQEMQKNVLDNQPKQLCILKEMQMAYFESVNKQQTKWQENQLQDEHNTLTKRLDMLTEQQETQQMQFNRECMRFEMEIRREEQVRVEQMEKQETFMQQMFELQKKLEEQEKRENQRSKKRARNRRCTKNSRSKKRKLGSQSGNEITLNTSSSV